MKLLLRIQSGSLGGRQFELTSGFLTVGRGEKCSVRFDPNGERIASKQHCYIEAKPDGFYLTDNKSTNGTLLNGQPIQTAKLKSGDRVQFGKNGIESTVFIESQPQKAPPISRQNFQTPQNVAENQILQADQPPQNQADDWRKSVANLGLQNPIVKLENNQTKKYAGLAAAIFTAVFLALIVVGIMFLSIGPVAAVIAAVVAFVPAIFYILPLMWLDRYDPEPPWALASAFAWGALVAVVFSFVVNTLIGAALGDAAGAVISAPVFEEGSKGLGIVLILIFLRREFDDVLDGIVYAGTIALGFATVENVLYYGRGLVEGGAGMVAVLFFVRGILSPFAHVTFTAMTGIGCGISRESHKTVVRFTMPIIGYGFAVLLHAVWNGIATFGGLQGFLLGYLVLEIPFFLIFVGFAIYTMRRQNRILKEMLAIDVARGIIPQEHLTKATSFFGGLSWIYGGIASGKYKSRRRYLRSIGKLGLSYWHIQRATAAQGQTGSFQQNPILREEVLKWKDKI